MEVRGDRGIEPQASVANLASIPAAIRRRQHHPLLGRRIAYGIMERYDSVALMSTRLIATAEEEAVARIQGKHIVTRDAQEGEGGVGAEGSFSSDVGEVVRRGGPALAVVAAVEEALKGPGQLLAVDGVRDEPAPGP